MKRGRGRPPLQDPRAILTARTPEELRAQVLAEAERWRETGTRPAGPDTRLWDLGDVVTEALERFFRLGPRARFPRDKARREEET